MLVQISTDEVFGDIEKGFFKEEDRHHASNPYSATKSAAEQIVFAWSRTYNIPYLMTRTTNNYGCRQHSEKLIPCAITKLLNKEKVPIHGDGSYIRNWIHVEDNISAIINIIDKGVINNVYHIASEEELSVKEIVKLICKKLNLNFSDYADFSTDRSGADLRYALDYNKIKSLGWSCKKNINDSLDNIIDFYRKEKNDNSAL
jgi:dTDP-glucose 4,6-dehydratase